jgi:hypothetical protein
MPVPDREHPPNPRMIVAGTKQFREKNMSKVSVRYIVDDVDMALPFYTSMLGFKLEMHPAPGFASLSRGDLQLLLNRPGAGGADKQCRIPSSLVPVVGTEYKSKSMISKLLLRS